MDSKVIYDVFYLLAAILFILGVKLMAHPRTARRGNMFGILGMTIAIVISIMKTNDIMETNEQLVDLQIFTLFVIGLCCMIGILFGSILATRVKMTEMPQLVAVFNGIGGLASVLVAGAALVGVPFPGVSVFDGSGGAEIPFAVGFGSVVLPWRACIRLFQALCVNAHV